MKTHKPSHIYDEIFRVNFYISYGTSIAELQAAIKKYIGKDWEAVFKGEEIGKCMCFELKEKGATVVWIWTKNRKPWVLAHECIHAMMYCFGEDKVKLDKNSEELFAYYAEMLMRKILKKGRG